MQAELTEHLEYGKHHPVGYQSGNSRNGVTKKTLKALGTPQKLTTSARIDLTRSQTDHAAWHADGQDLPHPCRRRVYSCMGLGTDVLPARPDRAPQAHARRRGSAVGTGWSKSFGE